tara:strand:+ start:1151 stop:1504 length:354 start_codon:yes stop_codon:yes gene_type:complete
MWLFTPEGMLSCTEYPTDRDYIQVRARQLHHLVGFIRRVDDEQDYDQSHVLYNAGTDYQYRVLVSRGLFADWMDRYATRIDYSNFKDRAGSMHGYKSDYVKMLGRIWEDGMDTLSDD